MWFGLFSLIFLDTSINVAMQPFKMMVGDMVNEEQKGKACWCKYTQNQPFENKNALFVLESTLSPQNKNKSTRFVLQAE